MQEPSRVVAPLIPDLLHPQPICRIDFDQTKIALAFAFASSGSGGLFNDALNTAATAPSSWDPSAFDKDLFLDSFVESCLKVRIDGKEYIPARACLLRTLASPPSDGAVIQFRREICAELSASPELRKQVEQLYLDLRRFRALLEGTSAIGKWDNNRRQLDILGAFKELVDRMARGFVTSQSGLARLYAVGRQIQEREPFHSLTELLRYDETLATLNLKVGVGGDGKIRGFEILSVQENQDNTFVNSVPRRWLAKLELFVRGFRFGDDEVLARLIDAVYEGVENDLVPLVQLVGDIEFYLGALGFHDLARSAGLSVCLPDFAIPGEPRMLRGCFNPLLLAHAGRPPVPCDINIDRSDTTLLLTGPNSGGKTRLLQSLGLTQLLAQSGLFVPASAATLALAPGLVVSLIQETKADQTEGRLGTELLRIRQLFEHLPPGAMVILDELCSGTNPSEGEEIFELVVRMLAKLRAQAFITTHFLAFAARLERERRIADLRFLQVALGEGQTPTYQFTNGVARTSLAGHAAARLGVTGDQLLSVIERNVRQSQWPLVSRRA